MKYNFREDVRKTFKLGSSDFKLAITGITTILAGLLILGTIFTVLDSFKKEGQTSHEYKICTKGILNHCVKVDRYRIGSGACVEYWGEKNGTLCGEFYIEENK